MIRRTMNESSIGITYTQLNRINKEGKKIFLDSCSDDSFMERYLLTWGTLREEKRKE